MKVRLEPGRYGALLSIPEVVLNNLEWTVGDGISIEVGLGEDTLILHKVGPTEHPKKLVVTGVTDKSRDIQSMGDKPV